jgi:hypothetical protein
MKHHRDEEIVFTHGGDEIVVFVEGDVPGGSIVSSKSPLFIKYFSSSSIWAHTLDTKKENSDASRELFISDLKTALSKHGWNVA